ncbi:hypothetical protein M430DRAFT_110707, partial [Amorphotheca resinae ATCC 22711]
LSGAALAALQEFYADREARAQQFEELREAAEKREEKKVWSMELFAEDWNESQFWYSDETATALARELLRDAGPGSTIVVVSAPSVFIQLKNLLASSTNSPKIILLEYDKRFAIFPEFIFYDFKAPLNLPQSLKGCADRIICDPPFLSEDCQTKAALTVRWLSKTWERSSAQRLIVCTGERMETLVHTLYRGPGIETTTFEPRHAKGLSNEFFCYANFESELWGWRRKDGAE